MLNSSSLSWPLIVILVFALAGATFLGYEHDLSDQVVAGIYTAIISGVTVGHFTTQGTNNG